MSSHEDIDKEYSLPKDIGVPFEYTSNGLDIRFENLEIEGDKEEKKVITFTIENHCQNKLKNKIKTNPIWVIKYYNEFKELLEVDWGSYKDINIKDNNDNTALIIAAINGKTDIVKLLIENGADIDAKNKYGDTTLTIAVKYGHTDIVELLKQAGAKE